MAEAMRVLDEAIAARARAEAGGARADRARVRAARGRGERRAPNVRGAWPTRRSRCSSARATMPGQCRAWYLRAQAAWIAGRVGRPTRPGARPRSARGARTTTASCSGSSACARPRPCSAPHRSTTRSAAAQGSASSSRPARWRGADGQSARVAPRHAGRLRAGRRASSTRPTRRSTSSAAWAGCRITRRSSGCSRAGPRWPSSRCAPPSSGSPRWAMASCWPRRSRCSPRRSSRKGSWRRPSSCAGWPRAPAQHDDIVTQVIWRGVQAKILAHQGRSEEAETLARDAVALVAPTDLLSHHGDAMLDLAEVLRTISRTDEYHGVVHDRSFTVREEGQRHWGRARAIPAQPTNPGDVDGIQRKLHSCRSPRRSGARRGEGLFVKGRTDDTAEPPSGDPCRHAA